MLGRRWFGQARIRPEPEEASDTYARWVLIHLFFITLMPFSTQIVGRYEFAPAIWLYAANTILAALAAIRLTYLAESEVAAGATPSNGRPELGLLVASAILSVVVSFFVRRCRAMHVRLFPQLRGADGAPLGEVICIKTSHGLCLDA